MKNYTYPRVVTSVIANKRSSIGPAPEDTTVLFVPIISPTGPDGELTKVYSLPEYTSKFGADIRMGRTLLNIANWLTAGGTLYTYKLVGASANAAKYSVSLSENNKVVEITGKYKGTVLNDGAVTLSLSGTVLTVSVALKDEGIRERFSLSLKKKGVLNAETNFYIFDMDVSSYSEYLSNIMIASRHDGEGDGNAIKLITAAEAANDVTSNIYKFSSGDSTHCTLGNDGYTDYNTALTNFWTINNSTDSKSDIMIALGNKLESPIDLIMDAGYPIAIKKAMIKVISSVNDAGEDVSLRSDIRGYFDLGYIDGEGNIQELKTSEIDDALFENDSYEYTKNIFLYAQHAVVSEETYFDEDMDMLPSYFISALTPTNDINNGIQFPLAGKRRAELSGIKKLSENPDPDQKEEWFKARVNYIEKDSRGYYFMSQRTYDGSDEEEYTALSFINNSRTTCKIVHDLERLGREYLFEFNDAVTLSNMRAVLNRYVTNWIANRTLSMGEVLVEPDEYSGEKVNVTLRMKFTGTIEVISIDIILD